MIARSVMDGQTDYFYVRYYDTTAKTLWGSIHSRNFVRVNLLEPELFF